MPRLLRFAPILALLAVAAVVLDAPESSRGARFPERAGPFPTDFFAMQREYPSGVIPHEKVLAAIEQFNFDKTLASNSTLSGPTWVQAGPFNIGGRVSALAVAPGGRTAYLGAANGGIFKSENSGTNWTPVFDLLGVFSIGALAMDPGDTNTVFAGTGEANSAVQSYDGNGIYRTKNGGLGWQYVGLAETKRIGRIAVDPSNSLRVYAAAMGSQFSTGPHRGLYKSEDGGDTWTKKFFYNDSVGVVDVVVNPAHPETVYIATWERVRHYTYRRAFGPGCGIWRSADYGETWSRLQTGLPAPSDDVGRIALAIAPSQPATIYAQIVSGANLGYVGLGVYRSLDGGTTWARRDGATSTFVNAFGGFAWYFGSMAVDPSNPNIIFCLGQSLVASGDGGASFVDMTGAAHVDFHAIWFDPTNSNRIYIGSDGGFFRSTAGGSAWTKSFDLPISQFYAGSVHPTDPLKAYGGTQDNGCLKSTGPFTWAALAIGGDGMYVVVDPATPNVVFAEYQFGCYGTGPRRSTNDGGSFSAPTGLVSSDRWNWSAPIVLNPLNHNVVLTASHRVYRSTNNGLSYSALSGDLTRAIPTGLTFSTISTLDISAADTSLYYAATDDGRVWRSQNRGGVWQDITAGLPIRWITRVSADPVDPDVVYVTLSGFGQDEFLPHVYRSDDRGSTWASISSNLPDAPANDILADPLDNETLYLATDVGVWASRNTGASWYPLGTAMPVQSVWDLTLQQSTRTLFAATYGRSQWKLDLMAMPVATDSREPSARLALGEPVPNPARGAVRWSLEVSRTTEFRADIYDILGRRVRALRRGPLAAGIHELGWDGRDDQGARVAAGAYFLRASAGDALATRRVIVAR